MKKTIRNQLSNISSLISSKPDACECKRVLVNGELDTNQSVQTKNIVSIK